MSARQVRVGAGVGRVRSVRGGAELTGQRCNGATGADALRAVRWRQVRRRGRRGAVPPLRRWPLLPALPGAPPRSVAHTVLRGQHTVRGLRGGALERSGGVSVFPHHRRADARTVSGADGGADAQPDARADARAIVGAHGDTDGRANAVADTGADPCAVTGADARAHAVAHADTHA